MDVDIALVELQNLKNNAEFLPNYDVGIAHLRRSGIFNFLRVFARPFIGDGGKDIAKAAMQASFVAGYHQAIADILYFKENHLTEQKRKAPIKATFGAYAIARERGDLTEEEIYGK